MVFPSDAEIFLKSVDNFLIICEGAASDFTRLREKLNTILNDLNSFDFKLVQMLQVSKISENIINAIPKIPIKEDTLLVKTFCLVVSLINKQTIALSTENVDRIVSYLTRFIETNKYVGICDALKLLQVLAKTQENCEALISSKAIAELLKPNSILLELIRNPQCLQRSPSCHYEGYSAIEITLSALLCLEALLSRFDDATKLFTGTDFLPSLTKTLLSLAYSVREDDLGHSNYSSVVRSVLTCCRYIGFANKSWCLENIGDILGVCVANMLFGLPGFETVVPESIHSSQQALKSNEYDCTSPAATKKGGKIIKTRKPRQTPHHKNSRNIKNADGNKEDSPASFVHSILFDKTMENLAITNLTTSESDTCSSDTEANQSSSKETREKEAKLRMASLSLISVIAKNVEKRVLFGYWHSLFPTEEASTTTVALLNCALRDSNQRCRMTALQATSLIIYGTKSFLMQADSTGKAPSTFMPFSVSLANRIHVIYSMLTQALASESSLPVLTQVLKCIAVLVQSTSFHKLKQPTGLVSKFVVYIRRLVHHKDPTLNVAALIVMEFLIADNEITDEISASVGVTKPIPNDTKTNIHDFGEDEVIDIGCDEECALEYDEATDPETPQNANLTKKKISWLLQVALENLGVTVCTYITPTKSTSSVKVRHESLQIIIAMARHFHWISEHLNLISTALINSICDEEPTVTMRAARGLDIIANAINLYLLSQSNTPDGDFDDKVKNCLQFWNKMLPCIAQHLHLPEQTPALRSILCDVYSNIGVHVYERLSNVNQMEIISLLNCFALQENEKLVNASAVRALAIFILFPSLREDICFIENTTCAIVCIMNDDNLTVRIKSSWALANVTDALVSNISDTSCEGISENLLSRLFTVTMTICSDTDKVRTNAARILGNLLRLITAEHLRSEEWQNMCMEAITNLSQDAKLPDSGANMKVKWNACYAIGNFMKNPVMFGNECSTFNWQKIIFSSLCDIIVQCPNFKVRINGAVALAVPRNRTYYGQYYLQIWNAMLTALQQANHLTDFNEYNHRDKLLDQLCITISHLVMNCTVDDLDSIGNSLLPHIDATTQNWSRVINRMVPEKAVDLLATNLYLKNIQNQHTLSQDQKNALDILTSCFVSITEYDD